MRFLIQRTRSVSVHIDGVAVTETSRPGMLILVGITAEDTEADIQYLVSKAVQLRIFDDEDGVMNRSILGDVGLAVYPHGRYAQGQPPLLYPCCPPRAIRAPI